MYHFNVPPSWPLPPNFIPFDGWEPPRSFEPVPSNWDFWILADYDPTLPLAIHDNRSEFNNNPLELKARQAELHFTESKKFLNLAIQIAYLDRKQKEQYNRSTCFALTTYEEHIEELIRQLVHLGSRVREARIEADQEYEAWKRNHRSIPSPDIKQAKVLQHESPNQIWLNPPSLPVYQKVPKYVDRRVETPYKYTEPEKPKHTPQITSTSENTLPSNVEAIETADSFWNYFIQIIDRLSIFNLSKNKKELIAAFEQAQVKSTQYESIVKASMWIEEEGVYGTLDEAIQAKFRRVENEAEVKLAEAANEAAVRLKKADELVKTQLAKANQETEAKFRETDDLIKAKLVKTEEDIEAMFRRADQTISIRMATANEEAEEKLREANEQIRAQIREADETIRIKLLQADEAAATKLRKAAYQIAERLEDARRTRKNLKETKPGIPSQLASNSLLEANVTDRKNVSSHERSQYVQREVEGTEEREEKNRFRKEAKVQNEIEEQQRTKMLDEHKAKIESENARIAALEYERKHIVNALSKADEIRKHNSSEVAEGMIADLTAQLSAINEAMNSDNLTTANTRAGWIYVISNVGSLGEGIVKIGVTRKQDPYDRIKELNNASVPFTFDIHVLHFTHDAVGLEAALHRHFALKKVNLINEKKEFFYASPEEVKEVMKKLSDGALTHFNLAIPAAEWRKSEEIRELRNCTN